eukprot:g4638.t1
MATSSSPFRTVNQINLSFFNSPRANKTPSKNGQSGNSAASPCYNTGIFSSPRQRGRVSPAIFDINMDHASIIGKSTRKKKKKRTPKLAKKTKRIMVSFLDTGTPSPLKLSKKTNQLFPSNNSNSIRKLATKNLMRNNNNNIGNKQSSKNDNYRNTKGGTGNNDSEQDLYDMYVPMHSVTNLYRRSEIMEHNIGVGIKLHEYLLSQGLTPTKASHMARPYFLEDFRSKTPYVTKNS